jgi:hypothetical protein
VESRTCGVELRVGDRATLLCCTRVDPAAPASDLHAAIAYNVIWIMLRGRGVHRERHQCSDCENNLHAESPLLICLRVSPDNL